MRETDNEEQGSGCDIDFASILLEIEPGYVVVDGSGQGLENSFRTAADGDLRGG